MAPAAWAPIEHEGRGYLFLHPSEEDHIFKQQMKRRTFYELDLLERIRELAPPEGYCIDVGAHVGNHSVYFAGVMKRKVYAFESNPQILPYLAQNVAPYDVQVFGCALASHAHAFDLVPPPSGNSGMAKADIDGGDAYRASETSWRRAFALDDFAPVGRGLQPNCAVLKIDVEGSEVEVLRGARGLIEWTLHVVGRMLLVTEAQDDNALMFVESIIKSFKLRHDPGPVNITMHGPFCATPTYIWELSR